MRSTRLQVLQEIDIVELLGEEPELLAIADAIASTQQHRRNERVARRRGHGGRQRGMLVVAAVAVVVLLAIGAALAATFGGFSDWLSGTPGAPATPTAQKQFRAANAHSYAGFPAGVLLHLLITDRVGGATYRLYGFRYGDELCLRLVAQGVAGEPAVSCAPRLALANDRLPAQVAEVDYGFGRTQTMITNGNIRNGTYFLSRPAQGLAGSSGRTVRPPVASASFGFVSANVSTIIISSARTSERAAVAHDAFLSVQAHPATIDPVTAIAASASGRQTAIPFAQTPTLFSVGLSNGPIPGPKTVQERLAPGSISWVSHHQPRGQSLAEARIPRRIMLGYPSGLAFARVIRPDPLSTIRIVVSLVGNQGRNLCMTTILDRGISGGCSVRLTPLSTEETYDLDQGGNQYEIISGLASDTVKRITVYLADGERWPVPLTDNAFAVNVPRNKLPVELVSYNSAGKIIGITPERGF